MPITRDPDFSPEIAALVDTFSRCSDGHAMEDVIAAAANMLASGIHNFAREKKMRDADLDRLIDHVCSQVKDCVHANWRRQTKPTDIEVKPQ